VLPAIHLKREDVGKTFASSLGIPYSGDPQTLTEAARSHLREKFLSAEAGITGVNFAVAETGGIVVCTNEGNADLGTALPPLHIACMGLEKVIPRTDDLAVFLRLLARSATGQAITSYTSHFHGPAPGRELHVVLVDNGRSRLRADSEFDRALYCLRCGACMNTCPVYRRSGGHSYGTTVPGPIGSILAPMRDLVPYRSLPYACTLCGSCTDVCPVEIDLHHQLRALRNRLTTERVTRAIERIAIAAVARVMRRPRLYALFGRVMRWAMTWLPRGLIGRVWGRQRTIPRPPSSSFQAQWAARRARGGRP
jgi:L-lactate dehydrogenase complex protein LldF